MSDDFQQRNGLVKDIFAALPPLAKTIFAYIILLPLALAVGGMLLQVNVGALIESSIRGSREQTVNIVNKMLDDRITRLDNKVTEIDEAIKRQGIRYWEMDKRLTFLESTRGSIFLPQSRPMPQEQ